MSLAEGSAFVVHFDDLSDAVRAWLDLLRKATSSTSHPASGGLFVGYETTGDERFASGRHAAALADAASPGELLSTYEPTDPDVVVERIGDDLPAIYSLRART